MKYIYSLFLIFILFDANAQRTCGTMHHHHNLIQQDPKIIERRNDIEQHTSQYTSQPNSASRAVVTIPVVVHVVYRTTTENISDAQIFSQLDSLNKDFRKLNADRTKIPAVWQNIAADCEIEFCLAKRDPSGNATTGIVRRQTTVSSFSDNDAMKYTSQGGSDAWSRNSYLNIWVCNLGGGILGYAQFPGGPAASDGVVVGFRYFGSIGTAQSPYNKGRTLTHEVGHWLNLYHIWGDDGGSCSGSDLVNDTPNQANSNGGCPTFPRTDNCSPSSPGVMFMNYMDYVNDACMYMFSAGQSTRMNALFATGGARASLKNSLGCVPVGNVQPVAQFTANTTSVCPGGSVVFTNQSTGNPTSYSWTFAGGTPSTSTATNPTVVFNSPGTYTISLTANNANGSNTNTKTAYITVLSASALPLTEGFQNTTFPPANWSLGNPDNTDAWQRTTNAGGFGASTASAYFDNYNSNKPGQRDFLYTPSYTFAGVANGRLKFDFAYTYYTNPAGYDSLEILYSENCGQTWVSLWKLGGTALATAAPISGLFVPTASQWRSDSISLSSLSGKTNVRFAFVNINRYGNTLFLDNINIFNATSSCNPPVANFTANPITVNVGGTVVFSDISTNNPTSWSWSFPGGTPTTSTAQNPSVVYNSAGTYNVTLTATNTCGASSSVTKTAYINVVNAGNSSCDTISNLTAIDTAAVYLNPPGYLSGHNGDGDLAYADRFTNNTGASYQVSGSLYGFGFARFANANTQVAMRVWAADGAGGAPNTVLATQNVPISTIFNNINANPYQYTTVNFASPPTINNGVSYYVGFEITYVAGDTVAIFTSRVSQSASHQNQGWIKIANGSWGSYNSFYNGLGLSNFVFPKVCTQAATPPVANFTATPTSVCAGATVQYNNTSTNSTSWSWSFPGGTPSSSNLQNPSVVYSTPGTYSVSLTASNGLTNTFTRTNYINVRALPVASTSSVAVACFGASTGSASVSVSSGTAPYTYAWSGGGNTSSISSKPAGTYTVTVTDFNQCSVSATASISQPFAGVTAVLNKVDPSCNQNNGVAEVIATGGVGNFTYTWSNGGNTSLINALSAGTYAVTVRDQNNCSITSSIVLNVQPNTLAASISIIDAACGANDGLAVATISGSSIGASFNWSNGSVGSGNTNLAPGTYSVTATNASGCTATASAQVGSQNSAQVQINVTPETCFGANNASAIITILSSGNFNISWSNGQTGNLSTALSPGNYSVTVNGSGGCQGVTNFSVQATPAIVLQTSSVPASSGIANGSASVSASGGTGNFTFSWSNGTTTSTASNIGSGTYACTVTDANGCTVLATVNVGVNGINDINDIATIELYPNPTDDVLTLAIYLKVNVSYSYSIKDAIGRVMIPAAEIEKSISKQLIDVSTYGSGVYFVEITINEQRRVLKFVKR
jgi:PKD repeat protein